MINPRSIPCESREKQPSNYLTMPAGGALFGSTVSRGQSKNLVEFKAGKMTMKGKMVHPDKRKGLVYVHQSDDSLMHFCWKDRQSGSVVDVSNILTSLDI